MTAKKKSKPMSASLKRFLKKYGRFPKKGELKRIDKRAHGGSKKKGAKKKSKHHKPKHHKKASTKRSQKRSRGLVFG